MSKYKDLQNTFSDRKGHKFKINNSKLARKAPNICKLNNTLVNKPLVKKKSRGELENILYQAIRKHNISRCTECRKTGLRCVFVALNAYVRKEEMVKNQLSMFSP